MSKAETTRNVILLGHGGVGKTSLAEAMLHAAGAVPRKGTIDQKNTVCDFEDLEKERQYSIDTSLAYFDHNNITFNIIDTPGYPDFIGQALAPMVGADLAAVCVSAATGIEVNTRRMLTSAAEFGLPRMVVINKIDSDNIDLPGLVSGLQETFGNNLMPVNLPAEGGSKVIDCLEGQGSSDLGDVEEARVALTEAIVENNEELMERYLGGEEVSTEELTKALKSALIEGELVPIVFTSADADTGVNEFTDVLAKFCPSPAEAKPRTLVTGEGEEAAEKKIETDENGPVVGQVLKIHSDPKSNIKYSILRLFSGTLKSDLSVQINEDKTSHRAGHIYQFFGQDVRDVEQACAGQIAAVAKIEELQVGDTVHVDCPGKLPLPNLPTPMYSLAIEPKSRGDEQKISGAMHRLSEEDPTFKVGRDQQTNETVISGIGDLHLKVILEKMARRFKLEVTTKIPKIPYKETITAAAEGHHRHKKQTGGAGQFGEVFLKIEPLERDQGFEFVDEIFGGAIPGQFLPAVEKGVRDVMGIGAIAGYPMQDIRVRVYDGKHHPVDSKEVAFRAAGKGAMQDAIAKAKPAILEPIVNLEVTVPSEFVGDITGDLAGRRGRIIGQDVLPGGLTTIKAQVPLAEVAQYNSQLRSVTGGQGSYTMEFERYDPVPSNVQEEIIKQSKPKEEEE